MRSCPLDPENPGLSSLLQVFQKRFNGSVSFFRGWNDYKMGFGRADGEYWLGKAGPGQVGWVEPLARAWLTCCPSAGLQNLHLLTLKQKYELRVDLEDFENNTAYAKYADFSIAPNAVSAEEDGYSLYVAGFEDGGAGTLLAGGGRGGRQPSLIPGQKGPQLAPSQPRSPGRSQARRLGAAASLRSSAPGLWLGKGAAPPWLSLHSHPSSRQATPCLTTAARSSPPSTVIRTSSCRTALPSPREPSGSEAATSPTSTASTWAAPISPTPTASTGPSGRASTTPSSARR